MRICKALLIVVDISGYTKFITGRTLALEHAEQVISDLLNAVLDQSRHPLTLNKLEGDAALMYAEIDGADPDPARAMLGQVRAFFPAFRERVTALSALRRNCSCDACRNITSLSLKAFVHCGDVLLKKIRQFDELAGEPVILLHRLMKNEVESNEYVMLTEPVAELAGLDRSHLRSHVEDVDGLGRHQVWLTAPSELPESSPNTGVRPVARSEARRSRAFRHLPLGPGRGGLIAGIRNWWASRHA
jgi:hypothetical protein